MPVRTNADGGGGAGSDDCTLLRASVPKGLKAVTADSGDEALEGTLEAEGTAADSHVLDGQTYLKYDPATKLIKKRTGARKNNGALHAELNCGEAYTIPAGDTTGGKVTAKSLASQTPGNAHGGVILPGYNAWVNGANTPGSMATQAARYINPMTYNQVVCGAGRYAAGDQGVYGDANLRPENIRKNVPIFGIMGSWQGFVDSPLYLYSYGSFGGGQSGVTFMDSDSDNILYSSYIQSYGAHVRLNNAVDFTNYKYLKMVFSKSPNETFAQNITGAEVLIESGSVMGSPVVASVKSGELSVSQDNVLVLDVSSVNGLYWPFFYGGYYYSNSHKVGMKVAIKQIILSTT